CAGSGTRRRPRPPRARSTASSRPVNPRCPGGESCAEVSLLGLMRPDLRWSCLCFLSRDRRGAIESSLACTQAEPLQPANNERGLCHGGRVVEHSGQLRMIFLGRTLESRADDLVTRFVVVPPGALEV